MNLLIKELGKISYSVALKKMQDFVAKRQTESCSDELWILEHPAVFTQGQAGKPEHILEKTSIPIVQSDRGGQVTYHAPGQLVLYLLLDLKKRGQSTREFVNSLEQTIINLLSEYKLVGHRIADAPGVYINGAKVASIGLRIKKGFCYHGVSINYNMDLKPFSYINPCGYKGLNVTQISDLASNFNKEEFYQKAINAFKQNIIHDYHKEVM